MSNGPALVKISLDADGDIHAIYELPRPIAWLFTCYNAESSQSWQETRLVSKVRVCLSLATPYALETTVLVTPFDKRGREYILNPRVFHGAASLLAGLNRLGFPPALDDN